MGASDRFDQYLEHVAEGLGHADRHDGLKGYCTGLMLPLARKSVEPMAARVDPMHASARHQALHHFVAKAEWSDQEMLRRVCQWVVPQMDFSAGGWWIIDDTGFPKKGKHSVGVARQYCGMLGKQDNCQVAVSVSLACEQGSLPVAWQLYLPEDWAADPARRQKAGVPEELRFATKTQIALAQLRALLAQGAPHHCVLADAGYGVDTAFRQALSDMGLLYALGVTSAVSIWPPGVERCECDTLAAMQVKHGCARFNGCSSSGLPMRSSQRHVEYSATTLRLSLSYQLIARLGQCPCCGRASARLLL
jgi:SRSO17 transposase